MIFALEKIGAESSRAMHPIKRWKEVSVWFVREGEMSMQIGELIEWRARWLVRSVLVVIVNLILFALEHPIGIIDELHALFLHFFHHCRNFVFLAEQMRGLSLNKWQEGMEFE